MAKSVEQRRWDIVTYCIPKPRTAKEIKKKTGLKDGKMHNDLNKLMDQGLIEKVIYNNKSAYEAVPTEPELQKKGSIDRGKIWRDIEQKGYTKSTKRGEAFNIPLPDLIDILSERPDNHLVDETWLDDLDIKNMSPTDYKKLSELFEGMLNHKDEEDLKIEITNDNVSGEIKGGIFSLACMGDAKKFVRESQKRSEFNRENRKGWRYKIAAEEIMCELRGEKIESGQKAYLVIGETEGVGSNLACYNCAKTSLVIDNL